MHNKVPSLFGKGRAAHENTIMQSLLAAIRFLTIAPVPGRWGTAEADLASSVPWFPVIGLTLGAIAAAVAWGLSLIAPPLVVAGTIIVVLLSFSGCLHLDGLSDTADGFLSSRSCERILEIMKDSHIGAMGVIAVVCSLLLKFASLASLSEATLWRAVLLMPLAGRCAIVVHMAILPYARPSGLGAIFYGRSVRWTAIWSVALFAAAAWSILGMQGMVVWAACIVASLLFSAYTYRKIGGATGDTFGAICELIEVVPALMLTLEPLQRMR
jgi:adenosylcobinamide-GDP ribazoletransferase